MYALGYRPPEDFGRTHRAAMHPLRLGRTAPEGYLDLPARVDLSAAYPDVYDQGSVGSCTAQALAGAVAYLSARVPDARMETPSRLLLYIQERIREGTSDSDAGAMLGDGVQTLLDTGWAPESLWPYDEANVLRMPYDGFTGDACAKRRLIDVEALDWLASSVQWELANGFAVVAGLRVYDGLNHVGADGVIPDPSGPSIGGHAVAVVGYDRDAARYRLRNSWGESWGDHGHGWISEAYLLDEVQCNELWALRAVRVLP
jgi:C1A family cysteine protease